MARDDRDKMPDRDSNENLLAEALSTFTDFMKSQASEQKKTTQDAVNQLIKASNKSVESTRTAMSELEKGWDGSTRFNDYMSKGFASMRKDLSNQLEQLMDTRSGMDGRTREARQLDNSIKSLKESIDELTEQEKDLSTGKGLGKDLVAGLKSWGDYALKQFGQYTLQNIRRYVDEVTSQIQNVGSVYRSTFTQITARQDWNKDTYGESIDRMQKWIEDNGLTDQLSLNDILPKLEETLAQGLRGQVAVTQAQYSSIASDIVPALDMNNRSLLQTINTIERQGGDVANFYSTLFGTITDSTNDLGNAFGIEAGIINQTIQGVGGMIKGLGLNETQSIQTYQAFIRATSALESINVDSSTLITDMSNMMNKSVVDYSTYEHVLRQSGVSAEKLYAAMESGDEAQLTEIFANYQHAQEQMFGRYFGPNGEVNWDGLQIAANNVYGSNLSVQDIVSLFKNNFNYEETMSKIGQDFGLAMEDYTKGDYQTKNEKYQNKVSNAVDDITIWAENNFAYGMEIIADGQNRIINILEYGITAIVGAIYANTLGKALSNNSGGSGSPLLNASMLKNSWKSGKLGNTFANIGSKGTKFTGAGAKWAGVARVGGGIGGALMMGADAVESWQNTKAEGGSTGEALGKAALGAFTGVSGTPESGWEIAGNTVKNAGKGAMIGTAILPGWGTAIGAGVGAVLGLVDSLARYNSQQAQLERSAESLTSAFQRSTAAAAEYDEGVKQNISNEDALHVLKNKETASQQQQITALNQLKKAYPDLLYSVEDLSDIDDEYVDLLEYKIQKEKELLKDNFTTDAATSGSEAHKGFEDWTKGFDKGSTSSEAYDGALVAQTLMDELSKEGATTDSAVRATMEEYGLDESQVMDVVRNSEAYVGKVQGVNSLGDTVDLTLAKNIKTDKAGNTYFEFGYEDSTGAVITPTTDSIKGVKTKGVEKENEIQKEFDTKKQEFLTQFLTDSIPTTFALQEDGEYVKLGSDTQKTAAQSLYESYNKSAGKLMELAAKYLGDNGYGKDTLLKDVNEFTGTTDKYNPKSLKSFLEKQGIKDLSAPKFATGLEKVPYDGYIAELHKDERVQTAAEVRMQTLEERVRDLLDNGTTHTTTETVVNTDSPNTVNAVTNQTQTLSQKLDIMIELLGQLVGMPTPKTETNGLKSYRNFNSNIANIPAMAE